MLFVEREYVAALAPSSRARKSALLPSGERQMANCDKGFPQTRKRAYLAGAGAGATVFFRDITL